MTRTKAALAALPLLALPLTACSSSSSSAKSSAASSPAAASSSSPTGEAPPMNPVTLLKKIRGCQFETGASSGQYDANQNMYSECEVGANTYKDNDYATGHDYTFTARTASDTRPQLMGQEHVDDAHAIIYGKTWYVVVSGTFGDNISPAVAQQYAAQLGGKVAKSDADVAS